MYKQNNHAANETEEQNVLRERRKYLSVCAIGMFFIGVIYGWSIFKAPLGEEFGWSQQQLSLCYTLSICCFCAGSLTAGLCNFRHVPVRYLLMASVIMVITGYTITAGLQAHQIMLLYVSYSVLAAGGMGIAYNVLLATGNSWFPDKKGTSSGIMMMLFGFSTMILGQIASSMFVMPAFGWRRTYLLLGAAIAAVLLFCAFYLRCPDRETPLPAPKAKIKGKPVEYREYTVGETIRRPSYWLFYLYGTLGGCIGSTAINFSRELALTLGAQAALATTLVGILSICNGLGRIISGLLYDWKGQRFTMTLVSIANILAPSLMLAALWKQSLLLGAATLCLSGFTYGAIPTISSAFIGTFYGSKDFALKYSLGNTKGILSSFAVTLASYLLAVSGSYQAPFTMLLVFAVIAFVLSFIIRRP